MTSDAMTSDAMTSDAMTSDATTSDATTSDAMKRHRGLMPFACDAALSIPALVLGLFWLMGAAFPAQLAALQWPILAFSALCLGFPHGACDIMALRGTGLDSNSAVSVARFCALYLALGAATLGVWLLSPALGLAAFLALTVWHWGEGDAWPVFSMRAAKIAASIGRGLIILSAPLCLQFEASRAVLHGFTALGATPNALDGLWTLAPKFLALGLSLQLGGGVLQFVREKSAERGRLAWWLGGETILILGFWSVVPPLVGVAVYLCGVHALRHLLRLEAASAPRPSKASTGAILPSIRRWHRGALGATVGGLVLLAPLLWLGPHFFTGAFDLSIGYFVLIAALTTPHAATVGFLVGRKQL